MLGILLPWADGSNNPDDQNDEKCSHASARVSSTQRSCDDVVTLETDCQNCQYRDMCQHQLNEWYNFA